MKHMVILSGSGISAESGLKTFRDSGGLWEGYNVHEVASIDGWYKDKKKVLDFYNLRRVQAHNAEPNAAHCTLAGLEKHFKVTIITQNVDDLHERGGASEVIHLHGLLKQARSEDDPDLVIDIGARPIALGDTAPDGAQLRPNVVWFGEPVPMMEKAASVVMQADIFVVVGTSLAVYPAAGLVDYLKPGAEKYIVDPSMPELISMDGWTHYRQNATTGVPKLADKLIEEI